MSSKKIQITDYRWRESFDDHNMTSKDGESKVVCTKDGRLVSTVVQEELCCSIRWDEHKYEKYKVKIGIDMNKFMSASDRKEQLQQAAGRKYHYLTQ